MTAAVVTELGNRREEIGCSPQTRRPRILVAENDAETRRALCTLLGDRYDLDLGASMNDALERYALRRPDLLVIDCELPDATGPHLVQTIRKSWGKGPPAILVSTHGERRAVSRDEGFDAFVQKPFRTLDLVWAIERALMLQR